MTYNDLEWLFDVKLGFRASTFGLKRFDFQR